jgi:hypothetical protein
MVPESLDLGERELESLSDNMDYSVIKSWDRDEGAGEERERKRTRHVLR